MQSLPTDVPFFLFFDGDTVRFETGGAAQFSLIKSMDDPAMDPVIRAILFRMFSEMRVSGAELIQESIARTRSVYDFPQVVQ